MEINTQQGVVYVAKVRDLDQKVFNVAIRLNDGNFLLINFPAIPAPLPLKAKHHVSCTRTEKAGEELYVPLNTKYNVQGERL